MQHLDEGTIHAWLDGALSADEAARTQRHAAACAACAALVAEARGLVAGASRIMSALDDVPMAGGGGTEELARIELLNRRSRRPPAPAFRPFWARRAALAAAASVVLVAGTALIVSKSGEPTSRAVDASARVEVRRTEAAADMPAGGTGTSGAAVAAPAPPSQEPPGIGTSGGTAVARQRRGTRASGRTRAGAVGGALRDSSTSTLQLKSEVVTGASPAAAAPEASRERAVVERDTAVPGRVRAAPPLAPDVASGAAGDTAAAGWRAAARRAVARSAAAMRARPEEAAVPTTARAMPQASGARADTVRQGRGDTVYRRRTDTVVVSRVDTMVVEPPAAPGLRGGGRASGTTRPLPVTGCYEVVAGGLPTSITLTTRPVWSGAAEQGFVATAPGAVGYWSQTRDGDVHLVIARAVVNARFDAATGELRGTAQRGRESERFVAKRGCR